MAAFNTNVDVWGADRRWAKSHVMERKTHSMDDKRRLSKIVRTTACHFKVTLTDGADS